MICFIIYHFSCISFDAFTSCYLVSCVCVIMLPRNKQKKGKEEKERKKGRKKIRRQRERESKGVVKKGWGETKGDTEQTSKNVQLLGEKQVFVFRKQIKGQTK